MEKINKWAADECRIYITDTYWAPEDRKSNFDGEWSIKKAECREIAREHFKITTDRFITVWAAFPRETIEMATKCRGNGKTIAEAEIASITAIYYEAHHETD